jgi:hypothetical protein
LEKKFLILLSSILLSYRDYLCLVRSHVTASLYGPIFSCAQTNIFQKVCNSFVSSVLSWWYEVLLVITDTDFINHTNGQVLLIQKQQIVLNMFHYTESNVGRFSLNGRDNVCNKFYKKKYVFTFLQKRPRAERPLSNVLVFCSCGKFVACNTLGQPALSYHMYDCCHYVSSILKDLYFGEFMKFYVTS